MATLDELRGTLLPAAVVIGPLPPEQSAREIAWVRMLRSRVPALDALEDGDVVIASAAVSGAVAGSPEDAGALADALAGRAAGLLVTGGDEDSRPTALVEAARARGVPVLRLPDADAAALERSVIAWLVNRRAALGEQAAAVERRLEGLALGGADLAALVAAFGGFLGRAAVLEGRRGDALAVHAPAVMPAAAAAAGRFLATGAGVALRVALPLAPPDPSRRPDLARYGEPALRGSLILLDDGPIGELERTATERAAALLALELSRDAAVHRARETARRSEALPADGPPWVVLVARQAGREDVEEAEQREAFRAELRMLAPNRRLTLRGDSESLEFRLVAVADADDPQGLGIAGRVAGFLRRSVAVSRPFADSAGRPAAESDARATLEAAERYGSAPPVVRADRLAAYRLLGNLHNLPDGLGLARALLDPLLGGRPALVAERLETLRVVLDRPGLAEAAAALGVHRNTIAYRIRRIESLGAWDLQDPELRLSLAVAVRIVQRAQVGADFATA
ncbi:MAG TPA: helix-turn-helix domain-containing protein [Patescibacteria group bacterium]|nr:helix-turn-helix domain-containing protein [Patescibacteria group bacterium]